MRSKPEGESGVCDAVEAVPADVCGDGNFDRQCEAEEGEAIGALAGEADEPDIQVGADAGATVSGVGAAVDGIDAADRDECGNAGRVDSVCGAAGELVGWAVGRGFPHGTPYTRDSLVVSVLLVSKAMLGMFTLLQRNVREAR